MSVGKDSYRELSGRLTRTNAGPGFASAGTLTGPWQRQPQQRSRSLTIARCFFPPASV